MADAASPSPATAPFAPFNIYYNSSLRHSVRPQLPLKHTIQPFALSLGLFTHVLVTILFKNTYAMQ
jgi:hypothetical protein